MKRHHVWLIWDTLRVAGIELGNHLAFEQVTLVMRTRESMARLTPRFSTNRAVREYTE